MRTRLVAATVLVLFPALGGAQVVVPEKPVQTQVRGMLNDPLAMSLTRLYEGVRRNLAESAELMPEAEYAFRPTPEVRSFGEILAHVAEAQFMYCAQAGGRANPNTETFEKTRKTKKDIVDALAASSAFCDEIYRGVDDAGMVALIEEGTPGQMPKAMPLMSNIAHDNEHYGNLVTYMRLKGIVPPSTARRTPQPQTRQP